MPNHQKPTKEELLKQEQEAIAEAEKLEKQPQKEESDPIETPEKDPEAEIEPSEEAVEPKEDEESDVEPEKEEEEQAEPSEEDKKALKEKLDAEKKKSSASARENQRIYAKNRVINKALTEADEIPEPTEEELQKEFKDWDIMSDTERTFAKETVISRNWRKVISQAKEQATKIEKWNDSVDTFIYNPQTLIDNPELEGKVEDFRKFAQTEENNSVPMKILVSAFLHENSKGKTPNKGGMFERGKGGENVKPKPKSNKLTIEEGRRLRETNYDEWKRKLKANEIESEF